MALKTAEQYEESLRAMNLKVYLLGEQVKIRSIIPLSDHP